MQRYRLEMSSGPPSINTQGGEGEHKWGMLRYSQTVASFHRSNVDQRMKEDQNDSEIPGWSCWKGAVSLDHMSGNVRSNWHFRSIKKILWFMVVLKQYLHQISHTWIFTSRWDSTGRLCQRNLICQPTHPHVLKTNYKITGWAKLVAAICLNLRHPLNAVPCKAWHEKLIEIDLERSAIKWIKNWLKDDKQRMMTYGTAVRSRVYFSIKNSVQCLHESGSEFISGQWGLTYKELKRI